MSVAKILTVAEAEFRAMVRSKAFLVSIVFLPILILGMSFLQKQISARADTSTRRFAVIDASGRFYDGIAEATRTRDSAAAAMAKSKTLEPRYEPERVDMGGRTLEQVRLELSDRVRKEQLFAFVEIPAEPDRDKLRYYSDHPASRELPDWLARTLDERVRNDRYQKAQLSPELVDAVIHGAV